MAEKATWNSKDSYFYIYMTAEVASDKKTVNWKLYIHYSKLTIGSSNKYKVTIDDQSQSGTLPAINQTSSGSHEKKVASGSIKVNHTAEKKVTFKFTITANPRKVVCR